MMIVLPLQMYVIGDTGVGKKTLVKAIEGNASTNIDTFTLCNATTMNKRVEIHILNTQNVNELVQDFTSLSHILLLIVFDINREISYDISLIHWLNCKVYIPNSLIIANKCDLCQDISEMNRSRLDYEHFIQVTANDPFCPGIQKLKSVISKWAETTECSIASPLETIVYDHSSSKDVAASKASDNCHKHAMDNSGTNVNAFKHLKKRNNANSEVKIYEKKVNDNCTEIYLYDPNNMNAPRDIHFHDIKDAKRKWEKDCRAMRQEINSTTKETCSTSPNYTRSTQSSRYMKVVKSNKQNGVTRTSRNRKKDFESNLLYCNFMRATAASTQRVRLRSCPVDRNKVPTAYSPVKHSALERLVERPNISNITTVLSTLVKDDNISPVDTFVYDVLSLNNGDPSVESTNGIAESLSREEYISLPSTNINARNQIECSESSNERENITDEESCTEEKNLTIKSKLEATDATFLDDMDDLMNYFEGVSLPL